jgi:peptidoglycan/xylan/chitin deacetylase (PgdA/CDA1 family)
MQNSAFGLSRRGFLASSAAAALIMTGATPARREKAAQIAITLDLEMSANFPTWDDTHWNYEKGNLNDATKAYALEAGRRVRKAGGYIHFFCVGRVLEQPDVAWLSQLAADGHSIGNHTYDHVNVLATRPQDLQFRFQRAPWLIDGMTTEQVIRENVRLTTMGLKQRAGIENRGFRTPGGFADGLSGREDIQQLLMDAGFRWVSSKYPGHANTEPMKEPTAEVYADIVAKQQAAQPFVYPSGLIEIPMSPISDIGAFRTGRWKVEWFLEAIRQSVTWAIENHAVFDFLAHPSCLATTDPEFRAIDLICSMVQNSDGRAKLVTLDEIADRVAEELPKAN